MSSSRTFFDPVESFATACTAMRAAQAYVAGSRLPRTTWPFSPAAGAVCAFVVLGIRFVSGQSVKQQSGSAVHPCHTQTHKPKDERRRTVDVEVAEVTAAARGRGLVPLEILPEVRQERLPPAPRRAGEALLWGLVVMVVVVTVAGVVG